MGLAIAALVVLAVSFVMVYVGDAWSLFKIPVFGIRGAIVSFINQLMSYVALFIVATALVVFLIVPEKICRTVFILIVVFIFLYIGEG